MAFILQAYPNAARRAIGFSHDAEPSRIRENQDSRDAAFAVHSEMIMKAVHDGRETSTYVRGNRMIDALRDDAREAAIAKLDIVRFAAGDTTQEPGRRSEWIVFPVDAVLSVVTTLEAGDSCEVGTLGNEGASGIDVAFGAPIRRTTICQIAGTVARMRIADFVALVARYPRLESLARATESARMFFVEQSVVCNAFHSVEQRCARWLLSMGDRVSRDEYALTQEYLSFMLGVRRPSVSSATVRLQELGAISTRRGFIRIVDRALLDSLACECYRLTLAVFDDSLGARAHVA